MYLFLITTSPHDRSTSYDHVLTMSPAVQVFQHLLGDKTLRCEYLNDPKGQVPSAEDPGGRRLLRNNLLERKYTLRTKDHVLTWRALPSLVPCPPLHKVPSKYTRFRIRCVGFYRVALCAMQVWYTDIYKVLGNNMASLISRCIIMTKKGGGGS
jgi:hypothetical protein